MSHVWVAPVTSSITSVNEERFPGSASVTFPTMTPSRLISTFEMVLSGSPPNVSEGFVHDSTALISPLSAATAAGLSTGAGQLSGAAKEGIYRPAIWLSPKSLHRVMAPVDVLTLATKHSDSSMVPLSFRRRVVAIHQRVRVAWSNSMLWNFSGCWPVLPMTLTFPVVLSIEQRSPSKLMAKRFPE